MGYSKKEVGIIILTKLIDDGVISVDYAANMTEMEKSELTNKSKGIKENNKNV